MRKPDFDPLFGDARPRRQLERAPLTGVLVQVRFGEIFSIQQKEFIADFQEKIRGAYPLLQSEESIAVQLLEGAPAVKRSVTWRFTDAQQIWMLSLAPDFIALQTKDYLNRPDFRTRLSAALDALATTVRPAVCTRIGARYANRIESPRTDHLEELFRPEITSFSSSLVSSNIEQSLTEALCRTREGKLLLRWGWMPKNVSHDPTLLPPVDKRSWILDIDSFMEIDTPIQFEATQIADHAYSLATRVNTFFQWAAEERLYETYGEVEV